jgi:uncharacterized protein (DUF1684 family)
LPVKRNGCDGQAVQYYLVGGDLQMKRKFLPAAAFVVVAMLSQSLAAGSDSKNSDDQSSWQRDLLTWRAQRATNLQAPEGWLSLIALGWLKDGDNTFGSAEDSRVQIAGKAPARIAVVRLEKGALRLLPPPDGFPKDLLVDGQPAKEQTLLADDADKPSKLTIGTLTIIVIHRDDQFALRVKDLQAPTRVGFHGLRWYAPNAAYRVHARWIPYNPPKAARHPDCARHHDPYARARRCRIHASTDKFSGWSPCSKIRKQPIFSLFFATPPAKLRRTARDAFYLPSFPTTV